MSCGKNPSGCISTVAKSLAKSCCRAAKCRQAGTLATRSMCSFTATRRTARSRPPRRPRPCPAPSHDSNALRSPASAPSSTGALPRNCWCRFASKNRAWSRANPTSSMSMSTKSRGASSHRRGCRVFSIKAAEITRRAIRWSWSFSAKRHLATRRSSTARTAACSLPRAFSKNSNPANASMASSRASATTVKSISACTRPAATRSTRSSNASSPNSRHAADSGRSAITARPTKSTTNSA